MSGDDILLWPDGTWCFRTEEGQYLHMSDDYEVLQPGTERWTALVEGDQ